MSWVAVGVGGASLVGSMASGIMGSRSADKGAKALAKEQRLMRLTMDESANEVAGYADEYTSFLDELDTTFDPYNMEEAFNSLYEGVIQPMERDFDENVLPGIQAAYSGGIMGAEAGQSGAAAEAKSNAERGLMENKASLRYQERGDAIQRNYQDYDRRQQTAGAKFGAETAAPMLRAGQAPQIFNAAQSSIAANVAAGQAKANILPNALSSGMGGATSGMSLANSIETNRYIKGLNTQRGISHG